MGFGGDPTYEISWLIDWLIDLFIYLTCVIDLLYFLTYMWSFYVYSLTPFHDSTLLFAAQVRIHSFWSFTIRIMILIYAWLTWVSIDLLIDCHVNFILSIETLL